MKKGIFRYFIVLFAACLFGGIIYLAVQNNSSNLAAGSRPDASLTAGSASQAGVQPPSGDLVPAGNRREGRGHAGGTGDLQGWSGLLKNAGILAAMTAGICILEKIIRLITRRRKPQTT